MAIDHGFLSDPRDADVLAEGVDVPPGLTGGDAIRVYAGREIRPGTDVDAFDPIMPTIPRANTNPSTRAVAEPGLAD